jgi:glycosyltransferase involved in cell wall biosynthesis
MRIGVVVQRYGQEVAGGAEALCRSTARALTRAGHEIVVFTTTARDYLTWEPHYPAGTSDDNGVEVRRFAVEPPDPATAARLVRLLTLDPGDAEHERAWARAQGPVAPGLLADLQSTATQFDAVTFWTYLYATTQLGLPLAADRSVLVPLAHDEPMIRFTLTRGLMRMAAGLAFLTLEEKSLVDDLHGIGDRPHAVVGAALDPAAPGDAASARRRFDLPPRFALYLGRVDPAKGVDDLVRAHAAYRATGGELGLVLAGRPAGTIRTAPEVIRTGFVTDAERLDLLAAADVVVLPSRYESLSLVALEAWRAGAPTLGTAESQVLVGQTARSGGGLVYRDAAELTSALRRLEHDADLRARLGAAGAAWVAPQTWPAVVARWQALLGEVKFGARHRS